MANKFQIDKNWTLFLDRDGVINRRLPGAYVRNTTEFEFLPGSLDALRIFPQYFKYILVVTNQQGVGKGLMSEAELHRVHQYMFEHIGQNGGKIDGIYYCPDLKTVANNCRKPAGAMALQAQKDFPEIDFHRSLMVGDSLSDMEFGDRLGMQNVLIETKVEELAAIGEAMQKGLTIHSRFADLITFAHSIREASV